MTRRSEKFHKCEKGQIGKVRRDILHFRIRSQMLLLFRTKPINQPNPPGRRSVVKVRKGIIIGVLDPCILRPFRNFQCDLTRVLNLHQIQSGILRLAGRNRGVVMHHSSGNTARREIFPIMNPSSFSNPLDIFVLSTKPAEETFVGGGFDAVDQT